MDKNRTGQTRDEVAYPSIHWSDPEAIVRVEIMRGPDDLRPQCPYPDKKYDESPNLQQALQAAGLGPIVVGER